MTDEFHFMPYKFHFMPDEIHFMTEPTQCAVPGKTPRTAC